MVQVSWCEVRGPGRRQEHVAGMRKAEGDELGDEELHKCLEALRCGKSPGCDNVPVEAYRVVGGGDEATVPHLPPHVAHRTHPAGARSCVACL